MMQQQEPNSIEAEVHNPLAEERELPSVNAKKKSSRVIGWLGIGFVAMVGFVLIFQMNTGPTRKEKAIKKKEEQEATSNAVSGVLPPIKAPAKPPLPLVNGKLVQEGPAPVNSPYIEGVPSTTEGQVPAPQGGQPLSAYSNGSSQAGQNAALQPAANPVKSARALLKERRLGSSVSVKFEPDQNALQGNNQRPTYSLGDASGSSTSSRPQPSLFGARSEGTSSAPSSKEGGSPGGDELSRRLQPSTTMGTLASKLLDRNYLIPRGAFLDCALETRIDSTVPGMTSCILNRNIYSDNGKLVLLDRGSKVTGQYSGGLANGQARIFVLWTRVETPNGIVINLDSPGTDQLGASGHEGFVNTHFWERFGAAMLLSLVDDAMNFALKQQANDDDRISFSNSTGSAQDMATEALKSSVNIPPTLMKNQGDHINIYVARDLDFRGVYGVRAN